VDARRSYYLAHRQDDFAESPAGISKPQSYEILYTAPANDNSPRKPKLSARCRDLFHRLSLSIARLNERTKLVRFKGCVNNGRQFAHQYVLHLEESISFLRFCGML
jgi:hypothetical protein